MSYNNMNLQQVLTQCHYDQTTKNHLYSEQMQILQTYQMNFKAVTAKLPSGNFTILEVCGTIPVNFQSNTYNVPIKLHYLPGYPNGPPVLIVNPSAEMVIKPSEYVKEDGRATLNIFNTWNQRLNTLLVLEEAKRAFSIKMPVFKKPKAAPSNSSPGTGYVQGPQSSQIPQVDPRYSSMAYPGQANPYNSVGPSYPGQGNPYNSVGPGYPGAQPGYQQPGYSSVQSGYLTTQPGYPTRPSNNYSTGNSGYPALPQQYSSVPPQSNQPDPRYTSANPFPSSNNAGIKKNTSSEIEKIKSIYKKTVDDLRSEVEVLKKESKQLESNSDSISKSIENFRSELNTGKNKLELMRANIENTQEWIQTYSASNMSDLNEEELVEYRNEAAKQFISLSSEEKSLESGVQVLVEAINKSVVPAKESLVVLKQLYTDLFLVSRLKEKAESISRRSN